MRVFGQMQQYLACDAKGALGGLVLRTLITLLGVAAGFIGALLGSLLLIWLWQSFGPRR